MPKLVSVSPPTPGPYCVPGIEQGPFAEIPSDRNEFLICTGERVVSWEKNK